MIKICYVYFTIKQENHDRISQQFVNGEARLCSLFALFLQRNGSEEHTLWGAIYPPGEPTTLWSLTEMWKASCFKR